MAHDRQPTDPRATDATTTDAPAPRPGDVTLTTPRLVLRPWRLDEAARLLDIRGRPEIARWLASAEPWPDLDRARTEITKWAAELVWPLGAWAIVPRDTGVPAGTVTLKRLPDDDVEVEIGWVLHPDALGQGLAREAARAVLDHAFAHGIARVWAIMWPDNTPSARVAAAIGMTDLGVRPDPWYGDAQDPDSRKFRIDRPAG